MIEIANKFNILGKAISAERYGFGHINDTYLVVCDSDVKYIMQRINHNVFKDVPALMENIVGVTEHIYKRLVSEGGDIEHALKVIPTREGKSFFHSKDGNYFRMYNFIDGAISIERRATKEEFRLAAIGFGRFQKMLDGFPANKLNETIKDFHNTRTRFENFLKAIEDDLAGRKNNCKEEIDFFIKRKGYSLRIVEAIEKGLIPLRVTHNDTKLNNVLINLTEMKASTVIDLDTVMPGSIVYDFGDSIRSGANTGAEDEKDLSKVGFSLELFEAYTSGFLEEVGNRLTKSEVDSLAFGAILMTFECGMRFLTDHLNGDKYFKIHRENHNLDRCRTQIKLVEEMEKNLDKMETIVKKHSNVNQ